jgi:hypothetical protein
MARTIWSYWGLFVFGTAIGIMTALSRDTGVTATLLGLLFTLIGGSLLAWYTTKQPSSGGAQAISEDTRRGLSNGVGLVSSGLLLGLLVGFIYVHIDLIQLRSLRNDALANDLKKFPEAAMGLAEGAEQQQPKAPAETPEPSDTQELNTLLLATALDVLSQGVGLNGRSGAFEGDVTGDIEGARWEVEDEIRLLEETIMIWEWEFSISRPSVEEKREFLHEKLDELKRRTDSLEPRLLEAQRGKIDELKKKIDAPPEPAPPDPTAT